MRYYLHGKRFGRLTVIGMVGQTESQKVIWECKCDCGTITQATASALMSGHKKSCGCLKRESHAEDLKGLRFGRLIVKRRAGTTEDRKALWRCKCDCGKLTTVRSSDLKSGNTKSCGCLHAHLATKNLMTGGYWNERK